MGSLPCVVSVVGVYDAKGEEDRARVCTIRMVEDEVAGMRKRPRRVAQAPLELAAALVARRAGNILLIILSSSSKLCGYVYVGVYECLNVAVVLCVTQFEPQVMRQKLFFREISNPPFMILLAFNH